MTRHPDTEGRTTRGEWVVAAMVTAELALLVAALQLWTGYPWRLLNALPELNVAGGMVAILALGAGVYGWKTQ